MGYRLHTVTANNKVTKTAATRLWIMPNAGDLKPEIIIDNVSRTYSTVLRGEYFERGPSIQIQKINIVKFSEFNRFTRC